MTARVGFGFDIHRVVAGRRLVLGGVAVPCAQGLLGHSDADVVVHAVASALLGAIGAGDLGEHFPDTDPRWRGADSRTLVEAVMRRVAFQRYGVGNVDVTVLAEQPRLTPFKPRMRAVIARLLRAPVEVVNVKASTSEGVGPVGRGEAVSAYAVVLVTRHPHHRQRAARGALPPGAGSL